MAVGGSKYASFFQEIRATCGEPLGTAVVTGARRIMAGGEGLQWGRDQDKIEAIYAEAIPPIVEAVGGDPELAIAYLLSMVGCSLEAITGVPAKPFDG